MAWGEAKVWLQGQAHERLYGGLLREAFQELGSAIGTPHKTHKFRAVH